MSLLIFSLVIHTIIQLTKYSDNYSGMRLDEIGRDWMRFWSVLDRFGPFCGAGSNPVVVINLFIWWFLDPGSNPVVVNKLCYFLFVEMFKNT